MSHAGFDLLLGARVRLVAATMLIGCSGGADDVATSEPHGDAGPDGDSSVTRTPDAGGHESSDVSNQLDRIDHPTDTSQEMSADVGAGDVAADARELALCLRLMDPQDKFKVLQLSKSVNDQYLLLIQADCRVYKALLPPGGAPAFADWRNLLYGYNPDLWGCTDNPAMGFALVSSALPNISPADTARLIELYLTAATEVLALTSREAANLRRDLQRLAGPLLADGSAVFTLSNCPSEAGSEADAPPPADAGSSEASEGGPKDAEAGPVDAEAGPIDAEAGPVDAWADTTDASEDTMDAYQGVDEGGD